MNPKTVTYVSECFIKPKTKPVESNQPCYLTPWDLCMLSAHYIQKGLLFHKPEEAYQQQNFINGFLDKLKDSLSITLVHFYPLAGRLMTTRKEDDPNPLFVYVDCNETDGARFIYADLDMTVSDIVSETYVPLVVQSLFDHDRAVNHDGHTRPLLSVQVTKLVDGFFIGASMNHCIVDGTSYWHFFNMWSEVFRGLGDSTRSMISRPPLIDRWFPDGQSSIIRLPFKHPDEFISRYEAPLLKERIFHFSTDSISKLKQKANSECGYTNRISSFQSLSALLWRCITRARRLPHEQETSCRVACNNRGRMEPPLSANYFGNSIYALRGSVVTVGELLEHNLGWAAWNVHQAVVGHNDKVIRGFVGEWLKSPIVYRLDSLFDPFSVMMGSSPRFNMYENEFGLGKAIGLRSGYANKFDGKVSSFPGYEGGGSIDLEVCLKPEFMSLLESDEEFMSVVSL